MGIRYFVFAVNKMDLVDYSEERFKEIVDQIQELSKELHLASVKIIPVSATADVFSQKIRSFRSARNLPQQSSGWTMRN